MDAMTKAVPSPVRRSCRAARFGEDGEIVIRGTFTFSVCRSYL
jgi:hypothetical protein